MGKGKKENEAGRCRKHLLAACICFIKSEFEPFIKVTNKPAKYKEKKQKISFMATRKRSDAINKVGNALK